MAKKTQYTKVRDAIKRYIYRLNKQGIYVNIEIPKTELQLRKIGITGQKLAAQTRSLQKILKNKQFISAYDYQTGETGSVKEINLSRKAYIPDGGEIIYDNFYDEFILKLTSPEYEYTPLGSKRSKGAIEESIKQKSFLRNLLAQIESKDGKSAIGWRLQDDSDSDELLSYVLYGSDSSKIRTASSELAAIIKGSSLTFKENIQLNEEMDFNDEI